MNYLIISIGVSVRCFFASKLISPLTCRHGPAHSKVLGNNFVFVRFRLVSEFRIHIFPLPLRMSGAHSESFLNPKRYGIIVINFFCLISKYTCDKYVVPSMNNRSGIRTLQSYTGDKPKSSAQE